MKECKMELQKTTSKTSLLNQMILRAWKERWSDFLYGINIKKVLPRGVSGDVYNLADCILQQALVGSSANTLVLNYLKHSLCAHLVSHAAVLRRISKYEHFERSYCVIALLEFLESIMDGVTCRNKPEETLLPSAMVSLVNWLMQVFAIGLKNYEINGEISAEQSYMLERTSAVIDKLTHNQFLLAILYVGRQEDPESYAKIRERYVNVKNALTNSNFLPPSNHVEQQLPQLAYIDVSHLEMPRLEVTRVEPTTYCVQPLLAVEVLLNSCNDTAYYAAEMQMLQRLKNFSNARLYYEIIRAGFVSLSDMVETSHDTMWGAFTFFKVPHIIKHLNALNHVTTAGTGTVTGTTTTGEQQTTGDYIPEVVEAFEMLLNDDLLLDFMDTKCSCNIIEYLLNEWSKQQLVNEVHAKHFTAQRENISLLLQKREPSNQAPSIINFIIRAEVPLAGVLKTLSTDYSKVQEALLGVLCQLLVGNSFDLLLSVATVEGRLKTFVSRLIQCNENSKQVLGEVGKPSVIRSTLFDISFLILTFIVQTYGSDVVLEENGDSFFEKWVRECMVERNKPKNPRNMIALCDENIVDELLLSLSKPETQLKNSNLTWQDICMNLPGVLHHVLIAWEKETLSSADVKGILDNIKRRLFCFSVCATSFLCSYMYSVRETEYLKPLNMIQQFLAPRSDEMSTQEDVKERLGLSFQIIRKMQHDMHPSGNLKSHSIILAQNVVSQTPLIEQFKEVWHTISEHGWLPARAAQVLESLLHAGGPTWLVTQLVEEIFKCKYTRDMMRTMDLVFAVLHLDIELTTEALLKHVAANMVHNRQGEDINEPQSLILARLCVYCIISALETRQTSSGVPKKRSRSHDDEEMELGGSTKLRKINADGSSDNSCSNDFIHDSHLLLNPAASDTNNANNTSSTTGTPASAGAAGVTATTTTTTNGNKSSGLAREPPTCLREPLQSAVQHIFKAFQSFVATEMLSPKVYFVYQFISLLVECGKDRVTPVLKLLPAHLISNLLKVLNTEDLSVGLISRLYDLRINTGRQAAVADLCLWRNLHLRNQCVHL